MSDNIMFAYGSNVVQECECPALQAGEDVNMVAREGTLGFYDTYLQARYNVEGVVEESEAREAWLDAIEKIEQECDREATHGRNVAETFGWL